MLGEDLQDPAVGSEVFIGLLRGGEPPGPAVTSNTSPRRLDAVSSGPKRRKLSEFRATTSRRNAPSTRVGSLSVVPGFGTSTA